MRETVLVWVAEAAAPWMVRVRGPPTGVVSAVLTVRVELPPALTVGGLKEALAPAGRPEVTERVTVSAEPERRAVVTL